MTKIKLIALDLDGTLLKSDKTISSYNKKMLHYAKEKGIKIVITTGRPLKAVEPILKELDLITDHDYAITFNGGLVQKNTGPILDKAVFASSDLDELKQATEQLGLPFDIISGGTVYETHSQRKSIYQNYNPYLQFVSLPFDELPQELLYNKAVSAFDQAYLDKQMAHLPSALFERFEIFKSRDILLEFMPKDVHKANGLAKLIKHLGIHQDEVMAMGDEENDLTMISWAGQGVAMQNAVPKLKEAADFVAPPTNDEDGVAWAIRELVLKED